MKTEWAAIVSAPRDRPIVVWTTQTTLTDEKPFAAVARFDEIMGWVTNDPNGNMLFRLIPTHWLPLPPPPQS